MNAYKPLIGFNLMHSIELLHDASKCSRTVMIEGIKPNRSKLKEDLEQSLMLVTALSPVIGYNKACEIAKLAHKENISLREAALKLAHINKDDFDRIVNPKEMINPK